MQNRKQVYTIEMGSIKVQGFNLDHLFNDIILLLKEDNNWPIDAPIFIKVSRFSI